MRNINYYIKRFGNFTLSERPFNEVDALILSELAYANFEGYVDTVEKNSEAVVFSTLNSPEHLKKLTSLTMSPKSNRRMIKLLQNSERFKNMKLNFYRSRFDADLELQFGAIVFMIEDVNIIAFRGTDTTLVGWKEDFNMSFLDVIPSQEQCLMYIHNVSKLLKGNLYLCGHSKGGNLANYAAIFTNKTIQERISGVYDFDGPGFKSDIFESARYKNVEEKIHKFITRDSMVGVIMNNIEKYEVVRCFGVSMMQHDPFRWRVTKQGKLDITASTTFNCQVFERVIKEYMKCYSDEERIKIIELLFDLLNAYEKSSFIDIKSKAIQYIHAIKKRYRSLDEEQITYLKKTFKEYWNLYHYVRKQMKQERKDLKKQKKLRLKGC